MVIKKNIKVINKMSSHAYSKRGKELVQIIYKINIIYPWTYKGRGGGVNATPL